MKRGMMILLILSVALAGAFAQATGAKAKATELKVFVPQSPGIPEGLQAIANVYMERNPGVSVKVRSVPFNKYKEQLMVMWASDNVDDVVTNGAPEIANFAYYDALLPLDDILPAQDRKLFVKSAVDAVTYKGKIYAYPFREAASVMYYNKDYFAKAGVVPATLDKPWTWQQWLANINKVRAAVKTPAGKDVWGLTFLANPGRGDFWLTPIIRSAGQPGSPTYKAISDDGMTLKGYADTPEALEAYRFYQKLYTEYKLAPTAEIPDAFATGQSATMISFLATANELKKKFPALNWGMMPVPYMVTPLVHTGGFTYSVSAKSKVPALAKDFVRFAGSEEGTKLYFKAAGPDLVSRIGFAEKYPEYYKEDYEKFFAGILERYGESRPNTPGYVVYNTIMGFNLFMDLATGADVAKTVQSKIQEFESQIRNM